MDTVHVVLADRAVGTVADQAEAAQLRVAEFGHTELGRLGLIGNGPDGTIGKHDMDRVQRMIDSLVPVFGNPEVNIEILEGLTAKDIATNEFIDDNIGL